MPCYTGEHNDVSRIFLSEKWESCLDEVYLSEEHYLELLPDEVLRGHGCRKFFNRSNDS